MGRAILSPSFLKNLAEDTIDETKKKVGFTNNKSFLNLDPIDFGVCYCRARGAFRTGGAFCRVGNALGGVLIAGVLLVGAHNRDLNIFSDLLFT